MNFWAVFLTGLTIGGLSCMAVQGGLLASVVTSRGDKSKLSAFWATGSFLVSKLIAYTLLGFLLGAVGAVLQLPVFAIITIQLLAGLYMIGISLNLLNVHPIFRRLIIHPPAILRRAVRDQAKSQNIFAPAFLGFMTIFIPCGTTLSMEALAISTTNGFLGAGVMAAFTLGTFPLFLVLGVLAGSAGALSRKFAVVPAAILIYLGLSSINGSLVLLGSPVTFASIGSGAKTLASIAINPAGDISKVKASTVGVAQIVDGVQVVNVDVYPNKYNPRNVQVSAGIPVRFNLNSVGGVGCTQVFVIPKLGISQQLVPNQTVAFDFTPTEIGDMTWTCGMGMYTGKIRVI